MKKLLLIFSGLLLAGTAAAQHVTNYNTKVAALCHGKPKRLIEISQGQGVCITEFDRNGRVVSEKLDKYDYTFNYRWTDTQLIVTACNDEGQVLNTLPLDYVEEPGRLQISSPTMGTIEFFFNENGTVKKVLISKNGQQGGFTAQYASDDPYCCTTFEIISQGKVAGIVNNEYSERDEMGNVTECVQRMNDYTSTISRRITYYDEEP